MTGSLWTAMNFLLDAPFFFGPLHMTASQYWSEIGLSYFMIPIFALGAARLAR